MIISFLYQQLQTNVLKKIKQKLGFCDYFIAEHPSSEMLALSFLILIGFLLTLEGVHVDVPKAYIYFAILFSLIVGFINMGIRKREQHRINLNRKLKDEG